MEAINLKEMKQWKLETARLRLRPFDSSDAPRVAEICGDFSVSRMCRVVPHPYSLSSAEFFINNICSGNNTLTFAVETRADNRNVIGCCSLDGIELVDGIISAAVGFWFAADSWGHGYATEAATALVDRAFQRGFGQLTAGHWVENGASARIQAKLGFHEVRRERLQCMARGEELDAVARCLARCEWEAAKAEQATRESSPGEFELVVSFPSGMRESALRVLCEPAHDRASYAGDEAAIDATWRARLERQPTLFNAPKFRLARVVEARGAAAAEESASSAAASASAAELVAPTLLLGLTDYKSYLGTNGCKAWAALPPACLASPLGNAAVVQTGDGRIVLLRRSGRVGEMPHTVVLPGGHAEPGSVGVSSLAAWQGDEGTRRRTAHEASGCWAERVRRELYESIVREVVEETAVPAQALAPPLCLGLTRRRLHHRPVMIFLIECSLTAAAIAEAYASAAGVHEESTSILLLEREELLRRVLEEEDATLPVPGCQRGGLELLRRFLEVRKRKEGEGAAKRRKVGKGQDCQDLYGRPLAGRT